MRLYHLTLKLGTYEQRFFHQTVKSGSWLNDVYETTPTRRPGIYVWSRNRTTLLTDY